MSCRNAWPARKWKASFRSAAGLSGKSHPKLREIAHQDFTDFSAIEGELSGYDACFFCLGVSSIGMTEVAYRRVTYEFTLAAARTLARLNPQMTFIYVSGSGTDSSESGSTMWARVKGETENELFQLPFRACLRIPACLHPAVERDRAENGLASRFLRGGCAPLSGVEEALAEVRDYHRADWPRDDPRRPGRRPQASAGESGYQRDLRPAPRLTKAHNL